MTILLKIFFLVAITHLALSSCAHQPPPESFYKEESFYSDPEFSKPNFSHPGSIERIRNLKPKAKFPLKVGVVLNYGSERLADRNIIQTCGEKLEKTGIIKSLEFVPSSLMPHCGDSKSECLMNAYRTGAARIQADALLILNQRRYVDEYANPFAILNLIIIGYWLAPGHHRDNYVRIEGVLTDIFNGYVFATAFGNGKATRVRPLFYANRDLGLGEAQNQAIEEICQQFQKLAKREM